MPALPDTDIRRCGPPLQTTTEPITSGRGIHRRSTLSTKGEYCDDSLARFLHWMTAATTQSSKSRSRRKSRSSNRQEETIRPMPAIGMIAVAVPRSFIAYLLTSIVLTGCTAISTMDSSMSPLAPTASPAESASVSACPVTEPVWVKPPDDPAVQGSPEYGYYFVNQDRSIWASAWWTGRGRRFLACE